MSVRINSGSMRGRSLLVPECARATTVRVRSMIFDTLSSYFMRTDRDWSDMVALDCFAGSGILGLESLSRGCSRVDLIEKNRLAIKALHKNINGVTGADIVAHDFWDYTRDDRVVSIRYNLFFMDPPYKEFDLQKVCKHARRLARKEAIYVLDMSHDDELPFKSAFFKRSDEVKVTLLKDERVSSSHLMIWVEEIQ